MKNKKGFYLVSPFLGFFFFLITVSIASFFITENSQQIDTAKAGGGNELIFISYAIQADAFDVYIQNFLQELLNTHDVYNGAAIRTEIRDKTQSTLSSELKDTYEELYLSAFGLDCNHIERAWSGVFVKFNGQGGVNILATNQPFNSDGVTSETAIWPHASRYGLQCISDEPPMSITTDFSSRWYYLDAKCICCQTPTACNPSMTTYPGDTTGCSYC